LNAGQDVAFMFKLILFDLDETLYPRSSSLMPTIAKRIDRYVIERVGVPPAQADELRQHWRKAYGTALRGMIEIGRASCRERV
jgi:putative hydrolase of the HAD superfamily